MNTIALESPLSRRSLFSAVAVVMAGLGLTGCGVVQTATTQLSSDAAQITADVNAVAAKLQTILPNIQGITGAAATVVADIQTGVEKVQSFASAVTSAVNTGVQAAQPYIQAALSAVTTIGGDVAGLVSSGATVPSVITDILAAAKVVLPFALSLAGVALAPPPGSMSLAAARKILAS